MFVHTVIMVIEPHMKQGRQHKLISTIFLATSVTKKLDHNNGTGKAGKRAERHSAAGRPYPAGGAGRAETTAAAHKGKVIDDRKHFTPQHGGTAL